MATRKENVIDQKLGGTRLRDILDYDPISGELTWRARDVSLFSDKIYQVRWNSKNVGRPALNNVNYHGYRNGSLFGTTVQAHRVAWAVHYGAWPERVIDHIDGVRSNNAISNLRCASHMANTWNKLISSKAKASKYKGVARAAKRWQANIRRHPKTIFLGCFDTEAEAAAAYDAAARVYHGEFARLNFPSAGEQSAHRGQEF